MPNSDQELDRIIISLTSVRWQKVAMVIGKALIQTGSNHGEAAAEQIASRIELLVLSGHLEGNGNLAHWRHSEVRLSSASGRPTN
jgi:hypothetical protein